MKKEVYTDLEGSKSWLQGQEEILIERVKYGNYVQIVPNSQFFNTLEQIQEYAKHKDNYLYIALKNTIEQGYKLVKKCKEE